MKNLTTIQQMNAYNVYWSDGVTVIDTIIASNLPEAKSIAKTNNYKTAYYQVKRAYNGG